MGVETGDLAMMCLLTRAKVSSQVNLRCTKTNELQKKRLFMQ